MIDFEDQLIIFEYYKLNKSFTETDNTNENYKPVYFKFAQNI